MRFSVKPFFNALSDGKIIRLATTWVLRVLGVISPVCGLVGFILILRPAFQGANGGFDNRSAGALLGSLILALLGLCWGYLCFSLCFFRASCVLKLADGHFTVLPILSILFKLNGEMFFITYSLIGIGGCLFVWFSDFSPPLLGGFPFLGGESTGFLGGIEFAVLGLLSAFIGIIISYALAELTVILVEIATNTRRIPAWTSFAAIVNREQSQISASAPAQSVASSAINSAQQGSCMQCGQVLEAEASYCAGCGSPLA